MIKEVNVGDNQVGHVVYDFWDTHPKILFIHQFKIYPEFRGLGYFKLLMAEIKTVADDIGLSVMALSVGSNEVDENWLRSLYSRYGFIELDGCMKLTS
jgi:GNAT superfamily N-acetyltransferase